MTHLPVLQGSGLSLSRTGRSWMPRRCPGARVPGSPGRSCWILRRCCGCWGAEPRSQPGWRGEKACCAWDRGLGQSVGLCTTAVSPARPGTRSWLPLFQGPLSTSSWQKVALARDNLRSGWVEVQAFLPPTSFLSDCGGSPGQECTGNKRAVMEGQWLICDFFWGLGSPSSHSSPRVTRWRCRASSLLRGLLGA